MPLKFCHKSYPVFLQQILIYSFWLFILSSCIEDQPINVDNSVDYLPKSNIIPLKLKDGYSVNPYTGDSVYPVLSSNGKTIESGRKMPLKWALIHKDSIRKPEIKKAGAPIKISTRSEERNKFRNPLKSAFRKDAVKKFNISDIAKGSYQLNSSGDTVYTGIPVSLKGKKVKAVLPVPEKSLPLGTTHGSEKNILFLDMAQGMPSSNVLSFLKDKTGNLWIGTDNGGVVRYNGVYIEKFSVKNGLSNDRVLSIIEDKNGNIWFGTYGGGVCMYDGHSFTQFTENEGFISNFVWSMLVDKRGEIWFGTVNGNVARFNGTHFVYYTSNEGFVNRTILNIFSDRKGNLWFGTYGSGAIMFDGHSFNHFNRNCGFPSNSIRSIAEDKSGNFWFGTDGAGVIVFTGDSIYNYDKNSGLPGNNVFSVISDSDGSIWMACFENGICKFNGQGFKSITESDGLTSNKTWILKETLNNKILIGTYGGGLCIVNENRFEQDELNEYISNDMINKQFVDSKGNQWTATFSHGVIKFDGKEYFQYNTENGLCNNEILSIYEDKKGNLWFGSSQGVSKFDGRQFINFNKKSGLADNNVAAITEDFSGNIWLGSDNSGITVFTGQNVKHLTKKEGFLNYPIRDLLTDSKGIIWIATDGGGITKYYNDSVFILTEREGLPSNNINSITQDINQNLWIGTDGKGLVQYSGRDFTIYDASMGLANDYVYKVLPDNCNRIWISTENGISLVFPVQSFNYQDTLSKKISPKDSVIIHSFGRQDGMNTSHFTLMSGCLFRDKLYFGTSRGSLVLDLNKLSLPKDPPLVYLHHILISEEFIDFKNYGKGRKKEILFKSVDQFNNFPDGLVLPYKKNHLNFHFYGIEWNAPHKIKYSFKIDELEEEWSVPSEKPFAEYRNLPYGDFVFKVRAIGESQVWSQPLEYQFTISPPWWHTWYARIVFGLVLVFLIIGYVRFRTFDLRRKQKLLNAKIADATHEIEMQNEELFITLEKLKETQNQMIQSEKMASLGVLSAGIAHEINNPLNFIQGGILGLEEHLINYEIKNDEQLNLLIDAIKTGVNRAAEIVSSMNNFSHQSKLLDENVNLGQTIRNCLTILHNEIKSRIEIEFKSDIDNYFIKGNEGRLHQAFLNILNNAIQAIENKGEISINLRHSKKYCHIEFTDNGMGISSENLLKITDPFYTTKSPGKGTGLGLSITYSIIKEHGGDISFESDQGKGTKVMVSLPLSHY